MATTWNGITGGRQAAGSDDESLGQSRCGHLSPHGRLVAVTGCAPVPRSASASAPPAAPRARSDRLVWLLLSGTGWIPIGG